MTMFIIQTLLLLAIAFVLGCVVGGLLRRVFGGSQKAVNESASEKIAVVKTVAAPEPEPVALPVVKPKPVPQSAPVADVIPKAAPAAPAKVTAKPKSTADSAPKTSPKSADVASGAFDDLKKIKGIGKQNEARLNAAGVTLFSQIAAWTANDQREMGERLAFPGRIEREEWVRQSKALASGNKTAFSKTIDKGEVTTSISEVSVADVGGKPQVLSKPRTGGADNLTLIDGIGNALETKLFALGIYHFAQIAKWNDEQQSWVSNELGFPGRAQRENWAGDAEVLARGGTTGQSGKVEKGAITSSRKSQETSNK